MIQSFIELLPAVQRIISAASGVPLRNVILADQNRQQPQGLYATYKVYPVRAVGMPRTQRTMIPAIGEAPVGHQDFRELVISDFEIMVSCNFLNEGAQDAAFRMHHGSSRIPVADELYGSGIGWRYCSDIRDLTDLAQGGLQPRYQTDLHLYVETAVVYDTEQAIGVDVVVYDEYGNVLN